MNARRFMGDRGRGRGVIGGGWAPRQSRVVRPRGKRRAPASSGRARDSAGGPFRGRRRAGRRQPVARASPPGASGARERRKGPREPPLPATPRQAARSAARGRCPLRPGRRRATRRRGGPRARGPLASRVPTPRRGYRLASLPSLIASSRCRPLGLEREVAPKAIVCALVVAHTVAVNDPEREGRLRVWAAPASPPPASGRRSDAAPTRATRTCGRCTADGCLTSRAQPLVNFGGLLEVRRSAPER